MNTFDVLFPLPTGGRNADDMGMPPPVNQRAPDPLNHDKMLRAEIERLRVVLEHIAELDPAINSTNGFNEWGEADCFIQAQQLARDALIAPSV